MTRSLVAFVAIALFVAGGSSADAAQQYRIAPVLDAEAFSTIPREEVASLRRAERDLGIEARVRGDGHVVGDRGDGRTRRSSAAGTRAPS